MAFLNDNYLKLQAGYLFPEIARRVREFCDANPDAAKRPIRCGIGDVTEPLPPAVIAAMHRAVDVDMDVAPDHRLDMSGHDDTIAKRCRGSASTSLKNCRCAMNGWMSP